MTDDELHDPDWTESDDRWTDAESEPVSISAVLYDGFRCPECGERVTLYEFDPDPDGPSWHGTCDAPDGCGARYSASPSQVTLTKYEPDA